MLAFITDPVVTGRILDHLGIASEQVLVAPAGAGPGQAGPDQAGPDQALPELDFGC